LFEVAEIDKIPYIDGGIMDNLPVSPIRQNCRRCIAVHVNPIDRQEKVKNLWQVAERAFHLALSSEINIKKSQVDSFIEPPGLMKYGILDVKKAQEIFNVGYTEAIRILNT
jgi:NTE family protein